MPTSIRQIEFLARSIVNRLEDRGLVEFNDAEVGIDVVTKTLEDNFAAYDAIEAEARIRLVKSIGTREPSDVEVTEAMKRVAAERNVTL
jgi:N-acetyl-anhydromuramyl-L-alanine amidase AmpD